VTIRGHTVCYYVTYRIDLNSVQGIHTFKINITMKSAVFQVLISCSSETDRRFGGTYRLLLQGWRVSQARNQQSRACAGFLHGLLFDPEDECDMVLRTVGLSPTYTTLLPRDITTLLHNDSKTTANRDLGKCAVRQKNRYNCWTDQHSGKANFKASDDGVTYCYRTTTFDLSILPVCLNRYVSEPGSLSVYRWAW
jgi:hypothetical protein